MGGVWPPGLDVYRRLGTSVDVCGQQGTYAFVYRLPVIDTEGALPVYVQIADVLEAQIKSGDLAPGRRIPSETDIRQTFGVARETARRAIALLRERGMIFTVPHRGSFVVERST